MIKCGQVLENGIESVCGKDICCYECSDRCENACKNNRDDCEFLRDTDETTDGAVTNPNVDTFLQEQSDTLSKIINFEIQKKSIEEEDKKLRDALKVAMEKYNIKNFTNERVKLTYIAPTTRTTIDSKKLKVELPDIANKYSKTSNVSATVKIEVK